MSGNEKVDCTRRNLVFATAAVGGVAIVAGAVPFVSSMLPSERAKAAGASVQVDVSTLQPGEMKVVEWRSKPVWIVRRTKEMQDSLKLTNDKVSDPESKRPNQPAYATNELRSIKPEFLVVEGVCSHLGCSPTEKFKTGETSGIAPDWAGGFLCPCHGSTFDLAGRVYKGVPAPDNLNVPMHYYVSDTASSTIIMIGEEKKGA